MYRLSQIVAEFERILGVYTSSLATFHYNFCQVAKQIIELGKAQQRKRSCGMDTFLTLLEPGEFEGDDVDNTPGKTLMYIEIMLFNV